MLLVAAPALAQTASGTSSSGAAAGRPRGAVTASQSPGTQTLVDRWGDELGLSTAQRAAIDHIRNRARRQRWSLMDAIRGQHAILRELYQAPTPDRPAIHATVRTIHQLRRQVVDVSKTEHRRIAAILTPRQREQLNQSLLRDDQQIW